jgi:hypothetical protein
MENLVKLIESQNELMAKIDLLLAQLEVSISNREKELSK